MAEKNAKTHLLLAMSMVGFLASSMNEEEFKELILNESDIKMLESLKTVIDLLIKTSKTNEAHKQITDLMKLFETES